jgi:methionine-gamma-lyase
MVVNTNEFHPDTAAVHGGILDYEYGPVVPPIYQVSTGADVFAGKRPGYIYTRMGNPTVDALERCIAGLEGGYGAVACSSGMAAVHTALATLLEAGDHLICSEAVYGPVATLIKSVLWRGGVSATFVDTSDIAAVAAAMRPNTSVIYVETPGNPTLVITDLRAVCEFAKAHDARVVVDNTFMSPILQKPFRFGADVVVHSLTKFLNGHADVIGGAVVCRTADLHERMRTMLTHLGGVLPPFESFLVHRGIKTLALRMRRHCESAQQVAEHLEAQSQVAWVRYPGLISHPQHSLARRQMAGAGGVISFGLRGGLEAGRRMMNAVRLCGLAVSLGGVESLIQHPASMTHASMGREAREQAGITDDLVRVSVGIEDVSDIIADLDRGLEAAAEAPHEAHTELGAYHSST